MRNLPNLLLGISLIFVGTLHGDEAEKRVTTDRIATTVSEIRVASETVIRSAAVLEEAGIDPLLSKVLNLADVDFEKQMVVVIRSGMTNAFGVELTILSTPVAGGMLTVRWQFKPYHGGAAPLDQPGNPTLVAVLDRYDGEVKFVRNNWKLPEGVAPPPGAPPSRGSGVPQ